MSKKYPLIPMSKITDEARKIAVAWVEGYEPMGSINLESKHKLASDIMNYSRQDAIEFLEWAFGNKNGEKLYSLYLKQKEDK